MVRLRSRSETVGTSTCLSIAMIGRRDWNWMTQRRGRQADNMYFGETASRGYPIIETIRIPNGRSEWREGADDQCDCHNKDGISSRIRRSARRFALHCSAGLRPALPRPRGGPTSASPTPQLIEPPRTGRNSSPGRTTYSAKARRTREIPRSTPSTHGRRAGGPGWPRARAPNERGLARHLAARHRLRFE